MRERLRGSPPPSMPASATGRWRPLVPVTVHSPLGSFFKFARALVDSGADDTNFPMNMISQLGIPLLVDTNHGITWRGQFWASRYAMVELQCQASYRLPVSVGRTSNWDDHSVNSDIFEAYRIKLPVLDQAMSALIDDLYARGLNKRVLFVFCGEFGRTPRIAYQDASKRPGRDHWPRAMSVFLSGGGLKMGQVIGATNSKGEHPVQRPMDSNCLLATIYHRFGIDTSNTLADQSGRPIAILPKGEIIRELVAA